MKSFLVLFVTFFFLVTGPTLAAVDSSGVVQVEFDVQLSSGNSKKFTVEVHPEWAPLGAERFLELVDIGDNYWKGIRFFRVIQGFMAQFGIPTKPAIASEWQTKTLKDDPVVESNQRGYISFATSGKDSRTTQMFINFSDNSNLDGMDFAPFAKVIGTGMADVVDEIFSGHGETPDQGRIQSEGNKYLKKIFPRLSYIKSVKRVDASDKEEEL